MINTRPSKQIPPKSQKAPSAPKTRNRSENVLVTKNVQAQLKAVANEAAVPLILAENNNKNSINTVVDSLLCQVDLLGSVFD